MIEPVDELVGALAAQRDADADGHALADLELGDRLAGAPDRRLLAGDRRELLGGGVEELGVLLGVTDAHVQGDLLEARRLHHRRVAEALDQRGSDLLEVARLEACGLGGGFHGLRRPSRASSRSARHAIADAILAGDPHAGRLLGLGVDEHDVADVDRALALDDAGLALGCVGQRALMALDDVQALDVDPGLLRVHAEDLARLAAVLAADDDDLVVATDLQERPCLEHLRGERDDLHVVAIAQLAGHRPEDAGPARVARGVDDHGGVLVEGDVRAVVRPNSFFVRTTTALTTSPFLTVPCGLAVLTVAVITSPTCA